MCIRDRLDDVLDDRFDDVLDDRFVGGGFLGNDLVNNLGSDVLGDIDGGGFLGNDLVNAVLLSLIHI